MSLYVDTMLDNQDVGLVKLGQRRIIEFFLDPLMTHMDGSLKVR